MLLGRAFASTLRSGSRGSRRTSAIRGTIRFQCACGQYIDYIKDRDGYPRLRLVDRFRGVRRAPHPDEHHVWDMFNFLAQGSGTKKDQTVGATRERIKAVPLGLGRGAR